MYHPAPGSLNKKNHRHTHSSQYLAFFAKHKQRALCTEHFQSYDGANDQDVGQEKRDCGINNVCTSEILYVCIVMRYTAFLYGGKHRLPLVNLKLVKNWGQAEKVSPADIYAVYFCKTLHIRCCLVAYAHCNKRDKFSSSIECIVGISV